MVYILYKIAVESHLTLWSKLIYDFCMPQRDIHISNVFRRGITARNITSYNLKIFLVALSIGNDALSATVNRVVNCKIFSLYSFR